MARTLQINLDGRDAAYLRVALEDLENQAYRSSANSPDSMERWRQIRDLKLRVGRAILRQTNLSDATHTNGKVDAQGFLARKRAEG